MTEMSEETVEITATEIITRKPRPAEKNIVGKCFTCKKDIDNVVEPFFTDSKKNKYCQTCYQGE